MATIGEAGASVQVDGKPADYYGSDRADMLPMIPDDAQRVLEVGCGEGGFGGALLRRSGGIKLFGIEPVARAAQAAERNYSRVIQGDFPGAVTEELEGMDCIVFNDVLEHMADPWAALSVAHRLLRPGGTVVASIPNVRYLSVIFRLVVRGAWEYAPSGVLDRTHLRFFTRRSIIDLFESTGFAIERVEGRNPLERWEVRVLRLLLPRFADDVRYLQYAVRARKVYTAS